jgi:hypothetical protein
MFGTFVVDHELAVIDRPIFIDVLHELALRIEVFSAGLAFGDAFHYDGWFLGALQLPRDDIQPYLQS